MMNAFIFLAATESGGQVERITTTFGVDWPHLMAQIISFSIVCAVLYLWAYKPVLKMLEDRRRQIALGQATAEQIKAELANAESQRQEMILKANAEATQIVKEAHEAAARVQDRETQKAIAAAEEIVAKSREAAAQDYQRMLAELKREVGRLVVQTAASVTGKVLNAEDQRRLAEATAKELHT
jgi:F-type H+-transporting ATPase subunit b